MSVNKHYRELALAYEGPVQHGAGDGNLTLGPNDVCALVEAPTSGTTTVTLPNIFDARGRIYSVIASTNDTGVISVVGDGSEFNGSGYTSGNLTDAKDFVLLYSDGVMWHELAELTT